MTLDERYLRQTTLIGERKQQQLFDAHVVVLGAGGLGSPTLLYLAGAGVGTITVIDDDRVDLSNLHRQVIHTTAAIGTAKTASAKTQMLALNPDINVRTVSDRLTWDNALQLFSDADIIVDGTDNFQTRHIASHAATRLGVPHVWGGQSSGLKHSSRCFGQATGQSTRTSSPLHQHQAACPLVPRQAWSVHL